MRRCDGAQEGTCLTVIIRQMLCTDDSVQVSLHELLDDCRTKIVSIATPIGQLHLTINLLEAVQGRWLYNVQYRDDLSRGML